MFKKMNLETYKKFIEKYVIDKDIKKEILDKINYFKIHGKILIEDNNLFAKIDNRKNKDYLEIRYEDKYFICNYTDWNYAKLVIITQKDLKNKNIKIDRKEKVEYKCNVDNNETQVEEIEKIYNGNKEIVYESELKKDYKYDTYENAIEYADNHYFTNYFSLNKKWYIFNGSIINYKMSKSFMNENSKLNETYSICPESYSDGFTTYYNFVDLNENLFKEFMSGSISIDELLEKIDKEEFQKKLVKNISNVYII